MVIKNTLIPSNEIVNSDPFAGVFLAVVLLLLKLQHGKLTIFLWMFKIPCVLA